MHSVSSTNIRHEVADLVNHGVVKKTKNLNTKYRTEHKISTK